MEDRYYSPTCDSNYQENGQNGGESAQLDLYTESVQDFSLPRNHRPAENLDTEYLEQASLDTQLTSSNVGFRLLQKMGWKGKGLGKNEQGIIEPIKASVRDPKLGVGKQEEDDYFTAEGNVQRKKLDIELEETEENVKKREVMAEREHKIQSEVQQIKKAFFCNLCNKQYKLAIEFESHLSSYDHNHRKRFKEMREMHGSSSSRDDRQKREQLRQDKEMTKLALMADARKRQQEEEQQEHEETAPKPDISTPSDQNQNQNQNPRQALKFGFSRVGGSKMAMGSVNKKSKVVTKVPSIFGNDSDEDQ